MGNKKNNLDESKEYEYFNQMEEWDIEDTPVGKQHKRVKFATSIFVILCISIFIFMEFKLITYNDLKGASFIFIFFGIISYLGYKVLRKH